MPFIYNRHIVTCDKSTSLREIRPALSLLLRRY